MGLEYVEPNVYSPTVDLLLCDRWKPRISHSWAKGSWNVAGSTVAHVGFGLIIAGALVSNANKDIISQNKTFIHEEFPANENLLIHQGDTVQMGDYWVSWTVRKKKAIILITY